MGNELTKLDELLRVLEHAPESEECESAAEHAQAARTYLLGSMPDEFALNIEMTRQSVHDIADSDTRRKAEDLVKQIRDESEFLRRGAPQGNPA